MNFILKYYNIIRNSKFPLYFEAVKVNNTVNSVHNESHLSFAFHQANIATERFSLK